MEKITQVLDKQLNVQHGENGHVEYTWSEETEAIIVQLSFQLVRGAPDKIIDEFHSLMNRLHKTNNTKHKNNK